MGMLTCLVVEDGAAVGFQDADHQFDGLYRDEDRFVFKA